MMHMTRTLALVPFIAVAAGCGGSSGSNGSAGGGGAPVSDKRGAAAAAYQVKQTGDAVRSTSSRGLRAEGTGPNIGDVPGATGNLSADRMYTVPGMKGKAILTEKADLNSTPGAASVTAEFTIEYQQYSPDGVTTYDGTMKHTVQIMGDAAAGVVSTQLTGTIDVSGKIHSHLDTDLSLVISGGGGTGSIKMQGRVDADGTRFDFANDSFDSSMLSL